MEKKTRELTKCEVEIFIMLEQNANVDELFKELKKSNGGWVLEAIEKRFESLKINVDKKVMIAVLSISDGAVGISAKYVHDIVSKLKDFHNNKITWNVFTHEIYPHGIPVL